jgi:hypothetical protein
VIRERLNGKDPVGRIIRGPPWKQAIIGPQIYRTPKPNFVIG